MQITSVLGSAISKAKRQLIKVLRFGKDDVQEIDQVGPSNFDSSPISEMRAIYGKTSSDGDSIIIGYINENALAEPGESRMYSLDSNGVLQNYIWAKNDGTLEIGGDADNMVRYSKLKSGFDQLKSDFNIHIAEYNLHAHPTAPVGPVTPPTVLSTPSEASISASKISEIKTS